MRTTFEYYYSESPRTETDPKRLWDDAVFVPDANVLLNIYGFKPSTRERWLQTLQAVPNLWLAHQVGVDYHRNLITKVKSIESEAAKTFLLPFQKCKSAAQEDLSEHPLSDAAEAMELLSELEKSVDGIKKQAEAALAKWKQKFAQDWKQIRDRLAEIISDEQIGPSYTQAQLSKICADGAGRYRQQIPPGYKDANKSEGNPYGDLIIWLQLIDNARKNDKTIVFITNDKKTDWFDKEGSPRPELVKEMYEQVGTQFHLLLPDEFLAFADDVLERSTDSEAIEETRAAQSVTATENPKLNRVWETVYFNNLLLPEGSGGSILLPPGGSSFVVPWTLKDSGSGMVIQFPVQGEVPQSKQIDKVKDDKPSESDLPPEPTSE